MMASSPTSSSSSSSMPSLGGSNAVPETVQRRILQSLPRSVRWRIWAGLLPAPTVQGGAASWRCEKAAAEEQLRDRYQSLVELHPVDDNAAVEGEANQYDATDRRTGNDPDDDDDNENRKGAAASSAAVPASSAADASPAATTATTSTTGTSNELDPLTAMLMEEQAVTDRLQEMDLKYRKERARRKRGLASAATRQIEDEDYDELAVTLQIIDKDLNRLPRPDNKDPPSSSNGISRNSSSCSGGGDGNIDSSGGGVEEQKNRKELLRQVLYVWACEHSEPGYRQGMHEVASWLLHALELDNTGDGAIKEPLMLAAETYGMLEVILLGVAPAYDCDVVTATTEKNISSSSSSSSSSKSAQPKQQQHHHHHSSKPLQVACHRILHTVAEYDSEFWHCLQELQVPAALYLTKWLRLLFSRECHSSVQVLELWDFLFQQQHQLKQQQQQEQQQQPQISGWMTVLEALAAARLLLWRRPVLFQYGAGVDHHHGGTHDRLHLLMNLPAETSVDPMVLVAAKLLAPNTSKESILATLLPLLDHNYYLHVQHEQERQQQQRQSVVHATTASSSSTSTSTSASVLVPNTPSPLALRNHASAAAAAAAAAVTASGTHPKQQHQHYHPDPETVLPLDPTAPPSAGMTNNGTNNKRFSLTKTVFSVREQAAQATNKLSKRLYKEWENLNTANGTSPDVSATMTTPDSTSPVFEDPLRSGFADNRTDHHQQQQQQQQQQQPTPVISSTSNMAMAAPPQYLVPPHEHLQQQQPPPPQQQLVYNSQQQQGMSPLRWAPNQEQQVLLRHQEWAQQLQKGLGVLQQFVMSVEQQTQLNAITASNPMLQQHLRQHPLSGPCPVSRATGGVPNEVWEALADLEILRQTMQQQQQQQQQQPPHT